jgi:hypothetical protein
MAGNEVEDTGPLATGFQAKNKEDWGILDCLSEDYVIRKKERKMKY